MEIQILPAEEEAHFRFIAKNFEKTIALWEDYRVSEESVSVRVEQIKEWVNKEDSHITVACNKDKELLGFNSLFIAKDYNGSNYGKIVILFVLPAYRNMGVARKIKLEGEEWLRSKGIFKVITEIDAKNERMLAINQKAGFRIKSYVMERSLSDA
ncbi:GNAT family N-acetyltransferase [Candidatus Riflebacteria bacterium]